MILEAKEEGKSASQPKSRISIGHERPTSNSTTGPRSGTITKVGFSPLLSLPAPPSGDHMKTEKIRVETRPAQLLATVRRTATLPELKKVVPEACGLVWKTLKDEQVTGAGRLVALYWDSVMNLEVGVEVDQPYTGQGEVRASSTPAGTVVVLDHLGPYEGLAEAHQLLRDFCKENGHEIAGPAWETYGHWVKEWQDDPSQIWTEIAYLLKT